MRSSYKCCELVNKKLNNQVKIYISTKKMSHICTISYSSNTSPPGYSIHQIRSSSHLTSAVSVKTVAPLVVLTWFSLSCWWRHSSSCSCSALSCFASPSSCTSQICAAPWQNLNSDRISMSMCEL